MPEREEAGPNRRAAQGYLRKAVEVAVLILFVVGFGFAFVKTLNYTMPFVIGLLLAIVLHPITQFLERKGAPRSAAVILSMVLIIVLFAGLLSLIALKIAAEASLLSLAIPKYSALGSAWLELMTSRAESVYGQLPPNVTHAVQSSVSGAVANVRDVLTGFFAGLVHTLTALPDWIVTFVIALLAAYFFLVRREQLLHSLKRWMPPGWDTKVGVVLSDVNRAFVGLVRAQVLLVAFTMVITTAGLLLMREHYAVSIGILTGISGLVPIVGSALITVPWAAFAFFTGNVSLCIKLLILQAFISLVRHLIEPKILAHSVGLDTLSTLFAMYVGLKLFGVLGLFLGPLFLIALLSLLKLRMFIDFLPDEPPDERG